jgi:deoxyribonuclease IV
VQAHERAVERGCEAMQVFNQSPRMWRPTRWKPDDVAAFLSLRKKSPVKSVVIHAVYLINPATKDKEMRKKSATSLIHALRMGDEIKADGVVLHPGSTVGEPRDEALPRVGEMLKHVLDESDACRLLLENTAGAGNTLGRSFEELREFIDLAGGGKRLGVCLDSCHMYASGFDIRTAEKVDEVVEEFKKTVGIRRLKCLHVNDSMAALGSNRDRHAIPGEGEIGKTGCAAFLSEPRFEKLPAFFEGPGTTGHAPDKVDVDTLKKLRAQGLRARKRRAAP